MSAPETLHDLLCLGRRGAVEPALWLYAVTVAEGAVQALGYTVRHPVTARSETLVEMRPARAPREDDPAPPPWRPVRGGLRVRVPKTPAGHHAHTPITLRRAPKRGKAT